MSDSFANVCKFFAQAIPAVSSPRGRNQISRRSSVLPLVPGSDRLLLPMDFSEPTLDHDAIHMDFNQDPSQSAPPPVGISPKLIPDFLPDLEPNPDSDPGSTPEPTDTESGHTTGFDLAPESEQRNPAAPSPFQDPDLGVQLGQNRSSALQVFSSSQLGPPISHVECFDVSEVGEVDDPGDDQCESPSKKRAIGNSPLVPPGFGSSRVEKRKQGEMIMEDDPGDGDSSSERMHQ